MFKKVLLVVIVAFF